MRASMPSPESVVFLLGSVALQMTTETYSHRLYQFDDWYIKLLLSCKSFSNDKNKTKTLLQDFSLFCYFSYRKKTLAT